LFEVASNAATWRRRSDAEPEKRPERKQSEILILMLVQTRAVAKKVVDKKPGVMLGSFEFDGSTLVSYSIGVGEPNYACPAKKEKERKKK
jgi:hypothetical protein